MMSVSPKNYGLFELDTAGNILYSRINWQHPARPTVELVGRNFFDDIAPFKNIEEFRRRFRYFTKSYDVAETFTFASEFEETPVNLKVMLTRVSEREFDGEKKLIIVDIRFGDS